MALIMMYLYYDERGEVKGISPAPEASLETFQYTTIALEKVEKFLTGQANPFDYIVKVLPGKQPTLSRKEPVRVQPRSQSQFLTEVTISESKDPGIVFSLAKKKKQLTVYVNDLLLSVYRSDDFDDKDEREELYSIVQSFDSVIYITEKGDPYRHITSVRFNVKLLFDQGAVVFQLPEGIDTENLSMYTKKLFESYTLVYV